MRSKNTTENRMEWIGMEQKNRRTERVNEQTDERTNERMNTPKNKNQMTKCISRFKVTVAKKNPYIDVHLICLFSS